MADQADAFDAPTSAPECAMPGINDFVEGLVRYQPRAINVLSCAQAHADVALANIHAGCLCLLAEQTDAPEKAQPYIDRARACRITNARERGLLALLEAWSVHDTARAARIAEQLLQRWPQDLSSLKLAQYHLFNRADSPGMLRVAGACRSANEHRAPWHSMLAFGFEQCHHIDAAERSAHKALDIDAHEPWAHHALAHVHLTRGSTAQGRALLESCSESWQGLNSFMFTHNWWHVALFEIAEGAAPKALRVYDRYCWGIQPEYSQDQIGAVSLLARLECAGVDVGDRWQALRPFLQTRADDVEQPFLALQYLYGLARCGAPEADRLLERCRAQAVSPVVPGDRALWEQVGVPAAEGCVAHARQDHPLAAERFAAVAGRLWRIGGSHAQRDLFEQLMLDALWHSEQWTELHPLLLGRLAYEPHNPVLQQRLGTVYEKLGLRWAADEATRLRYVAG